jgi:lipid-binding SYLF domain-containing protein
MRSTTTLLIALVALPVVAATGRPQGTSVSEDQAKAHEAVLTTIADFKKADSNIVKFFNSAVGYAVLPTVGKGAIGIGGAHGTGELIAGGSAIGKISMTQVTVGFQLGGQAYSEIIFFEKPETMDGFKHGDFAFAAQAGAVALASGASANANYRGGVVVYTATKGGLMYEASIGGQKFSFKAY